MALKGTGGILVVGGKVLYFDFITANILIVVLVWNVLKNAMSQENEKTGIHCIKEKKN